MGNELAINTYNDDVIVLADMSGGDALLRPPEDIRGEVQKYAIAALPDLFKRAYAIATKSKNEKMVLESMKFIKTLADGEIKGKLLEQAARRWSDDKILEELKGEFVDVETA